jgi:hypothetical protein
MGIRLAKINHTFLERKHMVTTKYEKRPSTMAIFKKMKTRRALDLFLSHLRVPNLRQQLALAGSSPA